MDQWSWYVDATKINSVLIAVLSYHWSCQVYLLLVLNTYNQKDRKQSSGLGLAFRSSFNEFIVFCRNKIRDIFTKTNLI